MPPPPPLRDNVESADLDDGNDATIDAAFAASVAKLEAWWTSAHNAQRCDGSLSASTVRDHVANLRSYRRWLEGNASVPIATLDALVQAGTGSLMQYLDTRRHLSPGTRAADCNAWLCAAKMMYAPVDEADPPAAITAVRRVRSQLTAEYTVSLKGRSSRESLQAAGKWVRERPAALCTVSFARCTADVAHNNRCDRRRRGQRLLRLRLTSAPSLRGF